MQNHLMQIMTLVAMEPPVSLDAEDIRNEKVKVLRAIPQLSMDEVVIGQYTAGNMIFNMIFYIIIFFLNFL